MIYMFSPVWNAMFGFDVVLAVVLTFFLKKKSTLFKTRFMSVMAILNIVYWFFYKYMLFRDPTYNFVLVNELPLHLCNINVVLIVFAINSRNPVLLNFCFCFGILGALMPIMAPDPLFANVPFTDIRGYGFYVYHHVLIVQSILLVSSGFYRPAFRDVPRSILILLVLYFIMFLVNALLRRLTGLPINYLYTYGLPGNPITDKLYELVPICPLFMLPVIVPLYPVLLGITALGRIPKPTSDTIKSV